MNRSFADFVAELMQPLGNVQLRRMFGGHGVYWDGAFIAIIADERLYFKADAQSQAEFEARGCAAFSYTARGKTMQLHYFEAPPEVFDEPQELHDWAQLALDAALRQRATQGLSREPRKASWPKTTQQAGTKAAPKKVRRASAAGGQRTRQA